MKLVFFIKINLDYVEGSTVLRMDFRYILYLMRIYQFYKNTPKFAICSNLLTLAEYLLTLDEYELT